MTRVRRALLTAALTVTVLALGATGAVAAYDYLSSNPNNNFATAPDFARPVVDRAIATHSNAKADYVKAGAGYYLYANVQTDQGNPPSGIATVTTNVSSLGGSTVEAMSSTGGPWTVAGQTYTHRSALLTASAGTSEGSKSFSITAADMAGNSGIDGGYTVTVDNTAPAVASGAAGAVIAKSSGGKAGFVKQSGTYYAYANPTDGASGVSSVTANVSTVTTGQSAAALDTTGGPWTVDGNIYTHRTAQLTANAGLTAGAKTWTLTSTDAVTNAATTPNYTVTADIAAPTLTRSIIAKAPGYSPSWIKQGGSYHVYAELADASSGVASATANVANATTGQTAAALTSVGGPWTVAGVTYAWRSTSAITASNPLAANTNRTWSVTATDEADNASGALAGTVFNIENTAPATANTFTATNGTAIGGEGGVLRRPDRNDKITFVFNDQMDTASLINGFGGMADNTARNVLVQLNDNGTATNNGATTDSITLFDAANPTEQVRLGELKLGRNFIDSGAGTSKVFGTGGAPSTMIRPSATPTQVQITLGAITTNYTNVLTGANSNHTMAWTPLAGMFDRAGNALTGLGALNGAAAKSF